MNKLRESIDKAIFQIGVFGSEKDQLTDYLVHLIEESNKEVAAEFVEFARVHMNVYGHEKMHYFYEYIEKIKEKYNLRDSAKGDE